MRIFRTLVALYIVASLFVGIELAEMSVHLPRQPLRDAPAYRARFEQQFQASVADVALSAEDKAVLKA
jgi:hypothetical protein